MISFAGWMYQDRVPNNWAPQVPCQCQRMPESNAWEAEIMEKLKHPYIESYLNCAAVLLEYADSLPGALLQVRIHETFAEDTALIIVTRSTGCWPAS